MGAFGTAVKATFGVAFAIFLIVIVGPGLCAGLGMSLAVFDEVTQEQEAREALRAEHKRRRDLTASARQARLAECEGIQNPEIHRACVEEAER